MKRKLGLVLAGGGGNGAYQMGVWKRLSESGITERISVISGTSVGALNAALFATTPTERAESVWTRGISGKILVPQKSTSHTLGTALSALLGGEADGSEILRSAVRLASNGVWSRSGLEEIIRKTELERLSVGGTPAVYATCFALLPLLGTRHFCLNPLPTDTVRKILLATSAIPLAFKPELVGGVLYYDGGLSCNVPLAPLARERCTDAIVVHLSQTERISGDVPDSMRVLEIRPSIRLSKSGVLDFSQSHAERLIETGYADCGRVLGHQALISPKKEPFSFAQA